MRPVVYLCVILAVAVGVSVGQLITPLMACEIQCLKDKGPDSKFNKTVISECDEFCYQQEYNLLISLLSSTFPPGLWDTLKPVVSED